MLLENLFCKNIVDISVISRAIKTMLWLGYVPYQNTIVALHNL